MGDTVTTGRPDYANTSRSGFAKINNEREPADAPEVCAFNTTREANTATEASRHHYA